MGSGCRAARDTAADAKAPRPAADRRARRVRSQRQLPGPPSRRTSPLPRQGHWPARSWRSTPATTGGTGATRRSSTTRIWNGRESETCDTTGAETDSGYTEARFNWNVARYLHADLDAAGARVILTRHSNNGVGPCVTTRAQIIDQGHANVAIDIHADGGRRIGRGFAILLPVADGPNDRVIASVAAVRARPAGAVRGGARGCRTAPMTVSMPSSPGTISPG